MSKEIYNNLLVIAYILLIFAFVGLAVHNFHSHSDIIEGIMYLLAAAGSTILFSMQLVKLFRDRSEDE